MAWRVGFALALAACGAEDDPGAPDMDGGEQGQIEVRIIAVPGTGKQEKAFFEWQAPGSGGPWGTAGYWRRVEGPMPRGRMSAAATSGGGGSGSPAAPGGAALQAGGPTLAVFTGGLSSAQGVAGTLAFVFDHLTGALTTSAMGHPRLDHRMTVLSDGRILVTGGFGTAGEPLASTEIFDPTTRTFQGAGDLVQVRGFHSAARMGDGRVLVSGSTYDNDADTWLDGVEVFDPETGTFEAVDPGPSPRWDRHASVSLVDGRVLLVGGNESRAAAVFDAADDTFSALPDLAGIHGYGLAAIRLADGRVLVTGGVAEFGGIPTAVAEVFDPALGRWTTVGPMRTARYDHMAILLPDGGVYVAGGQNADGYVDSAEIFDPVTGLFGDAGGLPESMAGSGIVLVRR